MCFRKFQITAHLYRIYPGVLLSKSAAKLNCIWRWYSYKNRRSATRRPSRQPLHRTPPPASPGQSPSPPSTSLRRLHASVVLSLAPRVSRRYVAMAHAPGGPHFWFCWGVGAGRRWIWDTWVRDEWREARSFIWCCLYVCCSFVNVVPLPCSDDLGRDHGARSARTLA